MERIGTGFSQSNITQLADAIASAIGGSGGSTSTGGLTNTELRATSLPISVASLPLPAGAATETTLAAMNTKLGQSIAVTGTFWQATQPVSGSITVSNFPASQTVAGTVSVGNFPATQAISAASLPLPTGASTEATLSAVNTKLAGTLAVREATDTGRTNVSLYAEAVAGAAAEALVTLSQSKQFAAASSGTSYTVTAGKTLRLVALVLTWVSTTTTANTSRVRIRVNTAGAALVTSPIVFTSRIGWESPTFIANESEMQPIMFPGGIDVPAGSGVAVTHQEAAANGTLDVTLIGFEF
jgi:hypothetical protein